MAGALGTSRFATTAMAPCARVRRTRRIAVKPPPSFRRPDSLRAAAADESSASAEAAESIAKDGGDDPDSGSPEMFDNLANIFLKRDQEDWIGLLASSERWPTLRAGFFARLKVRASEEEDPEEMLRLSRLLRLMQGTSERVSRYQDLLAEVQDKGEEMWEGMVTSRRGEFTTEFFQFVRFTLEALLRDQAATSANRNAKSKKADSAFVQETKDEAVGEDAKRKSKDAMKTARDEARTSDSKADLARDELARTASRLLSICEAFDEATKDNGALEEAAENFQELLRVETLEEMNQKIEQMSVEGKLDPALVLTAAKAYMSVKESPMVEEEVKDVMAHLYFKMKETMGRQQPKEVRIIKHLLAVGDDPNDLRNGLEEAFTPGPELTVGEEDFLFCEAPALLATVDAVLEAYERQQGKASITGQAAELMQPEVIEKLRQIKGQIEGNFL
jgi:hypothetical protein